MTLRAAALALGIPTGFIISRARMTDPDRFHRMLALDSARIYLLMGAAVAVAFVGARLLRGRRALLTDEPTARTRTRPTCSHVAGSVLSGIGWGISEAYPGPTAAQLGGGRVLAVASPFTELFRVLAPGGRIQIADVTIQNPVIADGRRNIDLWTR